MPTLSVLMGLYQHFMAVLCTINLSEGSLTSCYLNIKKHYVYSSTRKLIPGIALKDRSASGRGMTHRFEMTKSCCE